MVCNGELATGEHLLEICILEHPIFFIIYGLVTTVTFGLLTSKSNHFIFVPDCT